MHRDYRSGSVIAALWAGLGEYLQRYNLESMLGCASVPMSDGGHYAASLHLSVSREVPGTVEYHAFPVHATVGGNPEPVARRGIAALIKGYLPLGAKICGEQPVQVSTGSIAGTWSRRRWRRWPPRAHAGIDSGRWRWPANCPAASRLARREAVDSTSRRAGLVRRQRAVGTARRSGRARSGVRDIDTVEEPCPFPRRRRRRYAPGACRAAKRPGRRKVAHVAR